MSDVNEDKLVARVLREMAKIIEGCDVEGYPADDGEYIFDLEMTFINLAEAIKKRAEKLEKPS